MLQAQNQTERISIHALREEGDSPDISAMVFAGHFYPRPPRGGRPDADAGVHQLPDISIHALREEGDWAAVQPVHALAISIHALREEGDLELERGLLRFKLFLSTPSARRATEQGRELIAALDISIHALREEGDLSLWHL